MSRTLPTTAIQRLCSPEWIAKTYSEYMLDCANAQFNLINEVSNAMANDAIENFVTLSSDKYFEEMDKIVKAANDYNENIVGTRPYVSIDQPETVQAVQWIISNLSPTANVRLAIQGAIGRLAAWTSDPLALVDSDKLFTGTMTLEDWLLKYSINLWIRDCATYKSALTAAINEASINTGISANSQVILDDGCTTLADVITAAVSDASSLGCPEISIHTIDGTSIDDHYTISADDIFEQMKATASSAIAWGFGFASMSLDTMSDKMAYFESQVKAFISDTTESFASSVNVVRSRIGSAKDDILSFFEYAAEELGWNDLANDDLDLPSETDVFAYTGASPLGAIDTSTLKGVATAVAKTALAIGAGIFEGAKALLKKAWKKVKPYIKAVTDNPVDIGVCDESDKSYTVTNWLYHAENIPCWVNPTNTYNPNSDDHRLENIMQSKIGHWISVDTFFCEMQVKIESLNSQSEMGRTLVNFSYRMKPKCLNYRAMIKRGLVSKVAPQGTPVYDDKCLVGLWDINPDNLSSIEAWNDFATSGELYPENDEDEAYVFMGFVMSLMLMTQMLKVTLDQVYQWDSGDPSGSWQPVDIYFKDTDGNMTNIYPYHNDHFYYYTRTMFADTDDYWVPGNVSNLDFLVIASGFYPSGGTNYFDRFRRNSQSLYDPIGNTSYTSINQAATCMLVTFIMQQVDRHYFPSEYLYLPYYNNSYELSNGRYKIKTDAENANVANVIVNAIIVIAVVLTVVLVAKTVLKIRKRRKIAKYTQQVGELDNAMWNGHKMTFKERNRYFRAKNRLAKLEGASSGLAGSGSMASKIYKSIGQVQSLVVGQNTDTCNLVDNNKDMSSELYRAVTGRSNT